MSRRAQIAMSDEEVTAFLAEQKVANVATIGPRGRPHLAPVWYVPTGTSVATWTYRSSQKVRNLGRLAEATVLFEDGASYAELRGVSMECKVEILHDVERIAAIGGELLARYADNPDATTAPNEFVRGQATKRVGLIFTPTRVVSWDHRKLGGVY